VLLTILLQGKPQGFNNFQESDRIMKSIHTTILILTMLSAMASVGDAFGLVRQKALIGLL
jgi:hypothetical protein